jgi:phosphomannomutase
VQVSASHNPGEYNGFKIVRSGGVAMSGETGIQKLLQIIQNESFAPMSEQKGTVTVRENVTEEAIEVYAEDEDLASIKPYKIVIDTANAMGALDYEALFKKIPATIEWMNKELDGTFPAHEADPLKPENTEDIRKKVVEVGADLGIAADGDSDRVFIIDEKGDTLPSPILYALLSKELLKDHPTATYAYEIRLGKIINDIFDGTQAKLVPTPVGHSLEKQLMLEHDAIFGGEISGHYFFKFSFGTFEAPSLLVMKLLTLLSTEGKPLSELAAPYKKYFSSGEINTKMESREDIDAKVNALKSTYADGNQVLIDGVKVEYPAWWFSVRASNTEPVIRLVVEADTQEMMEQKRDELLAFIRS